MGEQEAKLNAALLFGPIYIGLAAAVVLPAAISQPVGFARGCAGIFALGFALFVVAKGSLFQKGTYLSFGSAQMSPWNKTAYRAGYALMTAGFVGTLLWLKVNG